LTKTNEPNPVYGKLGYSEIKRKKSIRKHLYKIDNWELYDDNGNIARKRRIIKRINDLDCYILKRTLDKNYEDKWEDIYKSFINEFIFPITPKYLLFIAKGTKNSIEMIDYRYTDKDTVRYFDREYICYKNYRRNI